MENKITVQTPLKLTRMVEKTKDKKSICNAFNRVFSKMGIYRGQIVPLNLAKIERTFQEFNIRPFNLRKIYKVIDNLNNHKAPGPGYINAWALNPENMLLGHIFRLYATIVFKRKFFQQFLRITPIFKKGDVSVLTNYRPISVTPTFAKVFERLLLNQLVEYLEKFALLNKK